MFRIFSRGFVFFAGVVGLPATIANAELACPPGGFSAAVYRHDPRLEKLEKYFEDRNCPAQEYLVDFLRVSDTYQLDWRLLPSLSVIESSGGVHARNHNWFGWANGAANFPSPISAIETVGHRLANSRPYRGKTLDGKLRSYNPRAEYAHAVKSVMRSIAPSNRH